MRAGVDPRGLARIAGGGYVAIFVLALVANFLVLEPTLVLGDPAATAQNLTANGIAFRFAVAAMLVVLAIDVVVGWALFLLFRPASEAGSLLMLLFRLVYTTAHIGVMMFLVHTLRIGVEQIAFAEQSEALRNALVQFWLRSHGSGFTVTLIFFGLHLVLLGRLVWMSGFLPRLIGALVVIAGLGYIVDGLLWILWAGYAGAPAWTSLVIVFLPAVIGEAALGLWLLFRGVDRQAWERAGTPE